MARYFLPGGHVDLIESLQSSVSLRLADQREAFWSCKDMNESRSQLIEAAKAVCRAFSLREDFSAGSVGAAILTAKGNIYTSICINLACGLGFCTEVAAVAEC